MKKIQEACALYDGSLPEYEINEVGIMVLCKACDKYLELLRDDVHQPVQNVQDDEQDIEKAITIFCKEPKSLKEIVVFFKFSNRLYLKRHYLDRMLQYGQL